MSSISKIKLPNNTTYDINAATVNGYTVATNVPSGAVFTDTKVTQSPATDNANYEVLFSGSADNTAHTEGAKKSAFLKYNPSSHKLYLEEESTSGGLMTITTTSMGTSYLKAEESIFSEVSAGEYALSSNSYIEVAGSDIFHSNTWDGSHYYLKDAISNVKQSPNDSTDAEYRILFSNTADDTERTEKVQKNSDFSFNPLKSTLKIGRAFSSGGVTGTRDTSIGIFGIDLTEYVGSTIQNQLSLRRNDITISSTWDGTHTSLKDALTSYSGGYTAGAGINISNNTIRTYGIGEYNNNQRPSFRFYSSNTSGEYTMAGLSESDNLAVFAVALSDAPLANHGALLSIKSVGTPCQFFFPDNQNYVYKRWYTSGAWTSWGKLNAGAADSVAWGNITGKPSTFPPSSHSHDYLPTAGGTMSGIVYSNYGSATWVNSLTKSAITLNDTIGFGGWICGPTKNGRITIATYKDGGDELYIGYGERGRTQNSYTNRLYWTGTNGTLGTKVIIAESILRSTYISRTDTTDSGYVNHVNVANTAYTPVRASGFVTMSCKHVKTNIEDISDEDAKKLLNLRPVNFDYVEEVGGDTNQVGVLAEDTYEILPKVVSVPDDYVEEDFDITKGIQQPLPSVDYVKFTPYLIKMVQIQQREIDSLKKIIEGRNDL